jgi:hypothetical protein
MKIVSLNREERDKVLANPSLYHYLRQLEKGRKATPRGWLYEDKDPSWIVAQVQKIIQTGNSSSPFREYFNQIEAEQWLKFGPQGEVPPVMSAEAMEVLEPLYEPSKFDDEYALRKYFKYAKDFAKFLFGTNLYRANPKSFDAVIDDMTARDTLSSNSGAWLFTRRSLVLKEEIEYAQTGKLDKPAIILFRQYHGKLRPVWMYPMSSNLLEFSFSQVIQDAMRSSPTLQVREHLSPWEGYEDVKKTLTKQWKLGSTIVGGDTTKMDAHMRRAQIRLDYEIVKHLFQKKHWKSLYAVMMQVTDIDLLVGPTKKVVGYHGLASGSGWTQLTETILILFLAWLKGVKKSQGIGDDFYFLADISADTIVQWLSELGLPANVVKQTVSKTILKFLQRSNVQGFFSREDKNVLGGYYPIARATESLVWPEKFHSPKLWNSDMDNVRKYMILENCVDDPAFEQFTAFVARGQKDMVTFAKKSASELARIMKKARLLPGLNPSYNQEKREKPLASFESIKYVREHM